MSERGTPLGRRGEDLTKALSEGNDHAFDEFWDPYHSRLVRFFCAALGSRYEAEELADDVILKLIRRAELASTWISTPSELRNVMNVIAKRVVADRLRMCQAVFESHFARSLRVVTRSAFQSMLSRLEKRLAILINKVNASLLSKDYLATFAPWFFLHGDHPPRILAMAAAGSTRVLGRVFRTRSSLKQ